MYRAYKKRPVFLYKNRRKINGNVKFLYINLTAKYCFFIPSVIKYDEVLYKMDNSVEKREKVEEENGKWEKFINYAKVSVTLGLVLGATLAVPLTIAKWDIIAGIKGFFITFLVGTLVGVLLSIMFAVKDGKGSYDREA